MGGETSKRPTSYDETVIHDQWYEQTYRHRCQDGDACESIPLGTDTLQIGVKIIQDNDSRVGEYYVMRHTHRIYLTTNGDWDADAAQKIEKGNNFGNGPAIMMSGPVTAPVYQVFGATDTMETREYKPMLINSMADLRTAVELGHGGVKQGRMAGRYGSLAVNPLIDAPSDEWTPSDFQKTVSAIGSALVAPIITGVVDDLTFGIGGTLMQVTGLSDKIAEGVQQLNAMGKEIGYESQTSTLQPTLFNMIKDPRMDKYYNQIKSASVQNASAFADDQYGKELGKAVNVPHRTQQDKFLAIQHFTDLNANLLASQKTNKLMETVNMLKQVIGNVDIPGFDWSQIDDGIQQASIRSAAATENVISYFTDVIAKKVLPVAQQILANQPPPPQQFQKPPPQQFQKPPPQQFQKPPPQQPPPPEVKKHENPTEYIKRDEPTWAKADSDQYPVRNTRNVHFDKKARTEAYKLQQYQGKKGSAFKRHGSLADRMNAIPKSTWDAWRAAKPPRSHEKSPSINGDKQRPSPQHVIHG